MSALHTQSFRHGAALLTGGLMPAYVPGEIVPVSGLYAVVHDRMHAENHEVTAVKGEPFPPCRGCGHGVRYRLVRAAKHLTEL